MRKTVLFSLILTALSWLGAPAREASDPTDIATATQTTGIQQQANETYVLTGKVVDENGVPLPGVNILIQGTRNGTATDPDGKYSITVKRNDVLRVSFIGYKDELAAVKGKKSLNVDLRPDTKMLKEVQVVAFGSQKKESVVSSITSIKPGDLRTSSSDLTHHLQERFPE